MNLADVIHQDFYVLPPEGADLERHLNDMDSTELRMYIRELSVELAGVLERFVPPSLVVDFTSVVDPSGEIAYVDLSVELVRTSA